MLQKTIFASLFIIVLFLSSTAFAGDRGLYLGAQLGAVFAQKSDAGLVSNMDFDAGICGAVSFGYDHGLRYAYARTELEYAFRKTDVSDGDLASLKVTGGEVQTQSLLLNVFYPFTIGYPVTPYIMGGLGAALVDISDVTVSNTVFIDNDQVALAYQVGAGIDLPINDRFTVEFTYRYFGTAVKEFENNALDDTQKKFDFYYQTHNTLLGLRYKF
jgi:opacity protein-like surface antigen